MSIRKRGWRKPERGWRRHRWSWLWRSGILTNLRHESALAVGQCMAKLPTNARFLTAGRVPVHCTTIQRSILMIGKRPEVGAPLHLGPQPAQLCLRHHSRKMTRSLASGYLCPHGSDVFSSEQASRLSVQLFYAVLCDGVSSIMSQLRRRRSSRLCCTVGDHNRAPSPLAVTRMDAVLLRCAARAAPALRRPRWRALLYSYVLRSVWIGRPECGSCQLLIY